MSSTGPETETHVWPGLSPYRFPVGPAAPVSDIPQVVLNLFLIVTASSWAYGSLDERIPFISESGIPSRIFLDWWVYNTPPPR